MLFGDKNLYSNGWVATALHPLLDSMAIVRVDVGGDDGVSQEVAEEHSVAQLVCGHTVLQ